MCHFDVSLSIEDVILSCHVINALRSVVFEDMSAVQRSTVANGPDKVIRSIHLFTILIKGYCLKMYGGSIMVYNISKSL